MEHRIFDDSIDMAKEAVREGMTTIIATPIIKTINITMKNETFWKKYLS